MYAVIGAGAGQHKVAEGQRVHVDLLDADEGDEVTLTAKMVVDGDTVLATPDQLDGVTVTGRSSARRRARRSTGSRTRSAPTSAAGTVTASATPSSRSPRSPE